MLEYIRGTIASLSPTEAVVDCSGMGYLVNISLTTYTALNGAKETRLLLHEVISDDAHRLFGFADERERALFRALIGVSGVGANTARIILSSIPPAELEGVIINGDHRRLTAAKGIGAKTAQRIIVDLRDKIKPSGDTLISQPVATTETFDEALAALVMLGFPNAAARKTLRKVFDADPQTKVETAIKKALAMM